MNASTAPRSAPAEPVGWWRHGLCREYDPEMWTLSAGGLTWLNKKALRICGVCPVRRRCRDDALDFGRTMGMIFGGWRFGQTGKATPHQLDLPRVAS